MLKSVQGYESNRDIADYYASQYVLFRKNRHFENVEEKIEGVTPDDINRVVKDYLSEDKAVTIYETPTLTFTQLYLLLSMLFIVISLLIIIFYLRAHKRFKK